MSFKSMLTQEQALQKLRHYCGYQERCHQDVRKKLFQLGVKKRDHDEIIASLIEEQHLNEERFAIAFAGGKFRINQWGKIKIRYELKQRQVSEYLINKALQLIPEEEYMACLNKQGREKFASLKHEQWLVRKKKTIQFLTGRGFEAEIVSEVLESMAV